MKNKLVFVDAETDGLYGGFLTVALIVTDWNANEFERAYYGIRKENMDVKEPWVMENVLPRLGAYEECMDETELLKKVWAFWLQYEQEAYVVCDVGYPVEMRLFEKCVLLNEEQNKWKAPFPMLDLSSILLAKGYEPLTDKEILLEDFSGDNIHCALYDVESTIAVWKKLMCEEKNNE